MTLDELKAYMHRLLHESAAVLGWTVEGGHYDDAATDCLLAYGVSDIADATDLRKLRTLARVYVWEAVKAAVSLDISFSADGAQFSRSHMFEHAEKMLAAAKVDALPYLPEYEIGQDTPVYQDPYTYQVGDEYAFRPGTYWPGINKDRGEGS